MTYAFNGLNVSVYSYGLLLRIYLSMTNIIRYQKCRYSRSALKKPCSWHEIKPTAGSPDSIWTICTGARVHDRHSATMKTAMRMWSHAVAFGSFGRRVAWGKSVTSDRRRVALRLRRNPIQAATARAEFPMKLALKKATVARTCHRCATVNGGNSTSKDPLDTFTSVEFIFTALVSGSTNVMLYASDIVVVMSFAASFSNYPSTHKPAFGHGK